MTIALASLPPAAGHAQTESTQTGPTQTGKASPACMSSLPNDAAGKPKLCIRAGSYNRDLCQAIETLASANSLIPDFFARLIWRESRFRPDAISPKGARGIAQFMPETALRRGLADSSDALPALAASARYLEELRLRFGNLGLAAAAYNAGEQRIASFMTSGSLPLETRAYVYGITGHTVDEWQNSPKELTLPVLDDSRTFMDACISLAQTRRLVEPADKSEGIWAPWGAQIAAAPTSTIARMLFQRAAIRLPAPLATEQPLIIRKRDRSFGYRPRYSARIARSERAEAERTCQAVRASGLVCLVFRNF